MSDVFRLPSLHLGTAFDQPAPRHALPVVLDQKLDGALALIDGAVRAPHRLARVVRPSGLLGIALVPPTGTVTVAMDLRVDELSDRMWHDHSLGATARLRRDEELDAEAEVPDLSGRYRIVRVTAQGRPVAAVALGFRPVDGEPVKQRVRFHVPAGMVGEDGLLILGLESVALEVAGTQGAMSDGAVGVAVGRVRMEAADDPVSPVVAVGRHEKGGAVVLGRPGVAVVNPGTGEGEVTVRVAVRGLSGDRLTGRRERLRRPVTALRQLAEERQLDRTSGIGVRVHDLDGSEVVGASVDGTRVRVPSAAGPFLVVAEKRAGDGTLESVDWSVRAR